MDTNDQRTEPRNMYNAQRAILSQLLPDIVNDVGMALRDAGLYFPIFITLPTSGNAIATIATPLDPSDDDWREASDIACEIIQKRIGSGPLFGRTMACAVANGTISAAEVTTD
jgi:hypothetical protein